MVLLEGCACCCCQLVSFGNLSSLHNCFSRAINRSICLRKLCHKDGDFRMSLPSGSIAFGSEIDKDTPL